MSEWISVKERLPSEKGHYLCRWHGVTCPEGMTDVLNFDGKEFPWTTIFPSARNIVTHWMPLPEPPKEG